MTLTEKILFKYFQGDKSQLSRIVRGETYIDIHPDRVIMQDATAQMTMLQFMKTGLDKVKVPASVHCDHLIVTKEGYENDLLCAKTNNKEVYEFLKNCCHKYGMEFWGPGKGVIHQIASEHYDLPGLIILGTDSHTPTGGAFGCISIGVGGADAVDALRGESVELLMPKIYNIKLVGHLRPFVKGKDVIMTILSILGTKGGTGYVLEYSGPGVWDLSASDKISICNMGAECGATTSIFPSGVLYADSDAVYDETLTIDLNEIVPRINGPASPDISQEITKVEEHKKIDTVLIGSCTNSSVNDLHEIAMYLKHFKKEDLKTKVIIIPGSEGIYNKLEELGDIDLFKQMGIQISAPSCGPCIGQWDRNTKGRNVIVNTFNRNFTGRNDGNPETEAYIVSPITALRYALSGWLDEPYTLPDIGQIDRLNIPTTNYQPESIENTEIHIDPNSDRLQELPDIYDQYNPSNYCDMKVLRKVVGKCTTDNISPAGKWLRFRGHLSNISKNFLLTATFSDSYNETPYETAQKIKNTVIVADWNYGEGSSREHAAIEARYLGIRAVIAKSFARIHETNLKRQGIIPLTFDNPNDYDKIGKDDLITLSDDFINQHNYTQIEITHTDGTRDVIKVHHTLSEKQKQWILKGSYLTS